MGAIIFSPTVCSQRGSILEEKLDLRLHTLKGGFKKISEIS